jgi:hypothetical protein
MFGGLVQLLMALVGAALISAAVQDSKPSGKRCSGSPSAAQRHVS